MRRKIVRLSFLALATTAIILTLPPLDVNAICEPPSAADSPAGIETMKATRFVVWGTIDGDAVPPDAHGAHSFFLDVRGYFQGIGPARIEVSDYGDSDVGLETQTAGASVPASKAFLDRFGGQDAVVFAKRDGAPYTGEYATNICTYTAYGDAESADILPLLRRVFGSAQPPSIAQTGAAGLPSLMVAAASLIAAGAALQVGGRRRVIR